MGEKVYLLNFKVSGIKNLEKTIELYDNKRSGRYIAKMLYDVIKQQANK